MFKIISHFNIISLRLRSFIQQKIAQY